MMQTLELFRDGAPTIEDNHAHHHHIHFTRNHTSTLKSLLQQGSMSTTTSPSSSTYSKPPSPLLLNKTPTGKNAVAIVASNNVVGRSKRLNSRCSSPYAKKPLDSTTVNNTSNSRLKSTLVRGCRNIPGAKITPSQNSESNVEENLEQFSEMKKRASDCISKLNALYNAMETGIRDLSFLWETITEMDHLEDQPGSVFLMDFEEDCSSPQKTRSSTATTGGNNVNAVNTPIDKAQRSVLSEQITKLINIESTMLNLIDTHQALVETCFGFGSQQREELERTNSSSNLSSKKLVSTSVKDIIDYIDFGSHIQRSVTCSKLFEMVKKIVVPNEEEAKEFCAVEVDIMGLTGASPVIRSLPSTFGNANQPKMKWKECLQLEKLNKKFQRKLNEFEEVVVIFFNMKQQR